MSKLKPCSISCVKCGSENIGRLYLNIGETIEKKTFDDNCSYDKLPFMKSNWPNGWTAAKEFIFHRCNCCQYEWQTDILEQPVTP